MRRALIAPMGAVAFLTRLPVGRFVEIRAGDVGRAAPLFPLVGGVVGGGCGLAADALADAVSPLVAGALAVGLAAAITGAMHLDALADAADALGGGSRERALEIMREHAVGAYGAVALAVVCLVDAAALAALADAGEAGLVALGAGAVGRATMLPQAFALPYARASDGQGRVLEGVGPPAVAVGVALGAVLAVPAGSAGLAGLGAAWVIALMLGVLYRRWLGGVTGDLLGATAKLTETGFLVAALATLD